MHEWEQAKKENNIESKRKLWEINSEEKSSEQKEKQSFSLFKLYI